MASPESTRRLRTLKPVLLPALELVDSGIGLRLTFAAARPTEESHGHWPLATGPEVEVGHLSAARISQPDGTRPDLDRGRSTSTVWQPTDMQWERLLLACRDEVALRLKGQRRGKVHEKGIACYGTTPGPTSRNSALFA